MQQTWVCHQITRRTQQIQKMETWGGRVCRVAGCRWGREAGRAVSLTCIPFQQMAGKRWVTDDRWQVREQCINRLFWFVPVSRSRPTACRGEGQARKINLRSMGGGQACMNGYALVTSVLWRTYALCRIAETKVCWLLRHAWADSCYPTIWLASSSTVLASITGVRRAQ